MSHHDGHPIPVSCFGMDGNPESLIARRQAACVEAGLDPDDYEHETEVIDTFCNPQDMAIVKAMYAARMAAAPGSKIRLKFVCVNVPRSHTGSVLPYDQALGFTYMMTRGGLWNLESFIIIPPRPKFIPFRRPKRWSPRSKKGRHGKVRN